jgi:hypothetical protein
MIRNRVFFFQFIHHPDRPGFRQPAPPFSIVPLRQQQTPASLRKTTSNRACWSPPVSTSAVEGNPTFADPLAAATTLLSRARVVVVPFPQRASIFVNINDPTTRGCHERLNVIGDCVSSKQLRGFMFCGPLQFGISQFANNAKTKNTTKPNNNDNTKTMMFLFASFILLMTSVHAQTTGNPVCEVW